MRITIRTKALAACLAVGFAGAVPTAHALSAQDTQAYCDAVKEASKSAKVRYVKSFTPRLDPGKAFDNATKGCLDGILNMQAIFQLRIPSIGDVQGMLKQLAGALLNAVCVAAQQEFDNAVQDALDTVNGVVQDPIGPIHIPGVPDIPGLPSIPGLPGGSVLKPVIGGTIDFPAPAPPPPPPPPGPGSVVNPIGPGG